MDGEKTGGGGGGKREGAAQNFIHEYARHRLKTTAL